ncbi:folylpolyglutamate synthase/dihydrofolate synthase family protein [Oceanicella sp. SM1341]|uniref:bifunctional folylpolyglutamate synthase/dihydrofolate synthase n=1 Tax=Oceanicella sp. SM1341 TaxID=1548889 RepID=UPI000E550111|nr:folylpolyglutamate synthase/dihydrofolate synthase family protein [Oceanicella sp. SM1341]
MMALHPKIIDLTLDRVHRLLAALGHPERALPSVIHVAGTNGKGSTQAMIRAGLEAAGDRVHAYTSPHLVRFHERIRLGGALIAESALEELLARCEAANGGAPITYFEITTCAALLGFAEAPAEWTLLEVGLGGRLDATNVIERPALTVITPVDLDHQQYLGETLEEIAGEKAGILKRGVPCIVGPQHDAARDVIEARAARVGAPLFVHGQDWMVRTEHGRLVYEDDAGLLDLPMPRLIGAHQLGNAGMAIAALRRLGRGDAEAAVTGPEWPARMQRLRHGPLTDTGAEIWLDGGHNPAAGEALAAVLAALPARPTHAICGMLNTKDIGGFLRPLAPHLQGLRAVSIPEAAATLPADITAAAARAEGIDAREAASVGEALADILAETPGARVLICGSLYLAGVVLRDYS